jgi:uncharacterized protein (DUF58 family)
VVAAASNERLWLVVVLYLGLLAGLVAYDWRLTPKPADIEVARINESKLSLGAQNKITLALHNSSPRTLDIAIRDEFPLQFPTDSVFLQTRLAPDEVGEVSYHVRPTQRGDYRFGNINLRYGSALGTFQRQTSVPFDEVVKVYPNVLDVRKYDMLARKGMLFELACAPPRRSARAPNSSASASILPTMSFARSTGRLRPGATS